MKTIAYLDCPSGISGDMCLGAILDAGVPLEYLQSQLDRLGLGDEFQLSAAPVLRQGLRALKARVDLKDGSASEPTGEPSHSPSHSSGHSHSSAHSHATHSHSHHSHHHTHGLGQTAQVHSHSHASSHSYASSQATADDHAPHSHGTRHLPEIEALITQANLPERACRWSLAVFRQLAEAEAAVHGIPIDQVHFHEVGATDALVDIVGTCLGLDYLGIDELYCSALPTGQGRVKAAHGWLPVPAPAVLKLMAMRQMPIYSNGSQGEQVTPTGAALVAALAQGFGAPPAMTLQQVGLGAGQKDFPQANILRLWVGTVDGRPGAKTDPVSTTLPTPDAQANSPSQTDNRQESPPEPVPQGQKATAASSVPVAEISYLAETSAAAESPETPHPATTETVSVLETQVDDMVPQAMGYLYERLFEAGALDVFAQPIAMKKSRTGLLITVICHPEAEARCTDLLFAETPTLGIRHRQQPRTILPRHFQTLATSYGPITLKVAYHPQTQAVLNVHPEYEDCAALARQHGVPWQVVYHTALGLWYQSAPPTASSPL